MRLINVDTLKLESFLEISLPPYAILSHTWEEEELDFQEWQSGSGTTNAGYKKICNVCSKAKHDGLGYCWVDTVCIDKSSSAELSEAITSMFAWYRHSDICYAYLADVSEDLASCEKLGSEFRSSRWFTRGWTLQELIAPSRVEFYTRDWEVISDKTQLANIISDITSIDIQTLVQRSLLSTHSISRRMSWAANRITTRLEDAAYCLFGIFDVNIPLLYGEGSNAFLRLQEEIIRRSDDETIFAWTSITELFRDFHELDQHGRDALKGEIILRASDGPEFPIRPRPFIDILSFLVSSQGFDGTGS